MGFVVPACPLTQIFAGSLKWTGYWQDQDIRRLGRISETRRSFLGPRSGAQKGRQPRRATPQQRGAHALRHRGLRRMMNSGARVRAAVSLSPSAPADGLFRSLRPSPAGGSRAAAWCTPARACGRVSCCAREPGLLTHAGHGKRRSSLPVELLAPGPRAGREGPGVQPLPAGVLCVCVPGSHHPPLGPGQVSARQPCRLWRIPGFQTRGRDEPPSLRRTAPSSCCPPCSRFPAASRAFALQASGRRNRRDFGAWVWDSRTVLPVLT